MKHTGCLHFITLMNLLYLPTSVNCPQDIISHIQVVHRLQVKSMHSLIRVWFLNPFRFPSSQCVACRQHLYKHQSSVTKSEAFQLVHHVTFILCYTVLYNFFGLRNLKQRCLRAHWRLKSQKF